MISSTTVHDGFSFTRLKGVLGETDGSLGAHLRRLEDLGLLEVQKAHRNRRPVTWYRLGSPGREALRRHLAVLTRLIDHAL